MPDATPRYLLPFETYELPHHLTEVLVVGTGVAGYSAALAAALADLLRDPDRCRQLGERGRQQVLGQFTANHMAERLETVLHRFAGATASPPSSA